MAIDDLNVLAVVAARGGSKSLPGRNLRVVGGSPPVAPAARMATSIPWIDASVLSTGEFPHLA